jgi:hypothetical protein
MNANPSPRQDSPGPSLDPKALSHSKQTADLKALWEIADRLAFLWKILLGLLIPAVVLLVLCLIVLCYIAFHGIPVTVHLPSRSNF